MEIICTVEDAIELMQHMKKDEMVTLTFMNQKTHEHGESKKIKKEKGEEYIKKAEEIFYQDNDFFGIFILNGAIRDKDIVHGVLFPQKE